MPPKKNVVTATETQKKESKNAPERMKKKVTKSEKEKKATNILSQDLTSLNQQ